MFWLMLLIAAVVQAVTPQPMPTSIASVRFHHLHYRAADPLTAMRLAGGQAASPEILQGLGVGVRDGAEYLLFDRGLVDTDPGPAPIASAYPRIAAWFRAHGVAVPPDPQRATLLASRVSGSVLEHLAFATANLPELLARLDRSGVRVTRRNEESFFVDIADAGVPVELVRDPDLPDRFWCPMHPDVRAPAPGACPICRMSLVPIPVPKLGEYRVDLAPLAAAGSRGLSGFRLRVFEPGATRQTTAFLTVHDKPLHLFVVSRDLTFFAHVHPVQTADGSFEVRQAVPSGEYMVIADFLPAGGTPQMVQRAVVTAGFDPVVNAGSVPLARNETSAAGDVRATIAARDLVAGRAGTLTISLRDAQSGAPVTDLEPYLSAPAHALIASADLTSVVHAHPRDQDAFGPELSFDVLPPQAGPFKIWVQIQRHGRVETLAFVVMAGER